MKLSSTLRLAVLRVVVLPLTVKSPVTVRLLEIVMFEARAVTPAFVIVISPETAVYVATPVEFANTIWAEEPDASFERSIAADVETSALAMVPSAIMVLVTTPVSPVVTI
jgi:hypothetical protein